MFRALLCPSSGALSNAEMNVFPAAAGKTTTSAFIRKPEAATAV
jgi:hypothetical protein